jgi:Saxitoxin biosynthesis operon protein SxtJ
LTDKIIADSREVRKFGITFWVVLSLFGGFLLYRGNAAWPYLFAAGGIFLLLGLVAVPVLRPIYFGWMKFAQVLAWINTRLILGVFFYVVMTPVGLIMRLIGRDPLQRKLDRAASSYWIKREISEFDRSRYERLF